MNKIKDPRITQDPDYVNSAKHNNSLKVLLDQNPDGVKDAVICRVLCISPEELQIIYRSAIMKLRNTLGENNDDEL
jgi:hypothetical protein